MALDVDGTVVVTARFSRYAAANGNGAWIVSTYPAAVKPHPGDPALTLAERLAAGYGDSDPFVESWRAELFL
jgi:hypothetical protein